VVAPAAEIAALWPHPGGHHYRHPGAQHDILRRLRTAGLEEIGDASVYGTLRRLFAAGYLTTYVVPSEEGPHRKYYSLNPAGRTQLKNGGGVWRDFAATMDTLLQETR